jgi:hypothetical protein
MTETNILTDYAEAKSRRNAWEALWKDCYNYALPQQESFGLYGSGQSKTAHIYDGTAMDAVEHLAASLLGNLTPPWSQWFGFSPGPEMTANDAALLAPALEKAAILVQSHLDRSNFTTEMHQAFLDLVTGGTGTLLFEEGMTGDFSAFRFKAIPLSHVAFHEGARTGRLDNIYRETAMTLAELQTRFPDIELPMKIVQQGTKDSQERFDVLETVQPDNLVYRYQAYLMTGESEPLLLGNGIFKGSPFIAFRWMKSAGEIYGRSPVMKALPDIKTANKVVELILKNASIAASGIWQADDDGVINPANIELTPGTIIPKAVGSKGLTPLQMPSNFDVSQIVLEDLRARIRHSLLVDRLGMVGQRQMTATEVLERSAEMALLLGATYGRLQSELLTPLLQRAYTILRRRGEVPDIDIDGRLVAIDYRSPLALGQRQNNVQNLIYWMNTTLSMGGEATEAIDLPATARHLGRALGVPSDLIRDEQALSAVTAPLDENLQPNQPTEKE